MPSSKEKIKEMKKVAAYAAIDCVGEEGIVGVGTGSTVNYFIDALAEIKHRVTGVVASSKASVDRLKAHQFEILDSNSVDIIPVYVDGADEIDPYFHMIKGGGGALTGEKIIASISKQFICIADQSKKVEMLGSFPVAVEVLPLARSSVARAIVRLDGKPVYREGVITDYGNIILDVYGLKIINPVQLEEQLNNIPGVVTNGIFARHPADVLLLGTETGLHRFYRTDISLANEDANCC